MKAGIVSIALILSSFMHPFHVGVAEIIYNQDNKVLQISQRMFADDLERGIRSAYHNKFDIMAASEAERDSMVLAYLKDHFQVKQQDKGIPIRYLGSEIEEEGLWAYFEIPVDIDEAIMVRNTILLDVFKDQQNLVHVTIGDETLSYLYNSSKKAQTIDLFPQK